MRILKNIIIATVVAISFSGCGWNGYKQHEQEALNKKSELDSYMPIMLQTNAADYIDEPPQFLKPLYVDTRPAWMIKPSITLRSMREQTLEEIMNSVAKATDIYSIYSGSIGTRTKIKLNMENASLIEVLEAIRAQADIEFTITGRQVLWTQYATKSFPIATLPGMLEFGMGNSSQSSGDEKETIDSTNSNLSQDSVNSTLEDYSQNKGADIEQLSGIQAAIKDIILETGSVTTNYASASLVVTTSPSLMRVVDYYISEQNKDLTQQAMLMVQVITFQSSLKNAAGINWNLVKTSTDGIIELSNSYVNPIDSNSFLKLSPTVGGLDGSSILVSALEQQGKVSVSNKIPVAVMNNKPTKYVFNESTGYVSNIKRSKDTDIKETTTELEKGVAEEGYTLYTLAKIMDNSVLLQLSSELSALKGFDTTEVDDITIKTPNFTRSTFQQVNIIGNGETLVANAYQQQASTVDKTSQFKNDALGGNSGETTTIETIVLITPTIL